MSYSSKIDLDTAFVPTGTPMFTDLIAILQSDQSLKPTRRRDMVSGLRRVAKAIGRAPQDVPCHGRWLQPRLAKIAPAAHGLSPKAWQNAVSDARAAMVHVGIVERRDNRITDLSPTWQTLWASVLASPQSKTLQPPLCRIIHFLNNQGVAPHDVNAKHALAYRDAVIRNEISKSPEVAYRAAVNGWNLAVRSLPDWPQIRLPLESRQKIIKLDEATFSKNFLADIDRLILHLARGGPRDVGRTSQRGGAT
jgi:hypothetical protein